MLRSPFFLLWPASLLLPLVFCFGVVIAGEEVAGPAKKLPAPVHYDGQPVKDGPPSPDPLRTRDGVRIVMTYYPGAKGKDTLPVVLLHDRNGSRTDYTDLAVHLQSLGHVVIVPDLRGHGDSTKRKGTKIPLSASNLSRADFVRMVLFDMEAVREFLFKKNNAGELNVEKLCVVGAGMGAAVALNWTHRDWSYPPIGPGNYQKKQGQYVKALVLLSPNSSTPGLSLGPALFGQPIKIVVIDRQLTCIFKNRAEMELPTFAEMKDETEARRQRGLPPKDYAVEVDFRKEVSVLIAVGKNNSKALRDSGRLYKMFKRYHPDPPPAEKVLKSDLFYDKLATRLQGVEMLDVPGLNLQEHITRFIELRLVNRSFPWGKRGGDPYAASRND